MGQGQEPVAQRRRAVRAGAGQVVRALALELAQELEPVWARELVQVRAAPGREAAAQEAMALAVAGLAAAEQEWAQVSALQEQEAEVLAAQARGLVGVAQVQEVAVRERAAAEQEPGVAGQGLVGAMAQE